MRLRGRFISREAIFEGVEGYEMDEEYPQAQPGRTRTDMLDFGIFGVRARVLLAVLLHASVSAAGTGAGLPRRQADPDRVDGGGSVAVSPGQDRSGQEAL